MMTRVLGAALPQVLRSVAWLLLPTSFVALLAWATAGSATGNTGDPLRAALWIWIGAHQIPFSLSLPPSGLEGYLSYLPLGALIFPVLAIRSGIARTIERLDNDSSLVGAARAIFAIGYTLFALLASLFSKTESVKARLVFRNNLCFTIHSFSWRYRWSQSCLGTRILVRLTNHCLTAGHLFNNLWLKFAAQYFNGEGLNHCVTARNFWWPTSVDA